jgi:hypothetical protein
MNRDAVALAHADCAQAGADGRGPGRVVAPGDLLPATEVLLAQRDAVGVLGGARQQHLGQRSGLGHVVA